MGTKILVSIIACFFTFSTAEIQQKDIFDTLSGHFKTSNSGEISSYFAPMIELDILNEDGEYSKAQAELILRDFLSKNKPESVIVIHRLSSSSNYRLGVLSMQVDGNKFRLSISMAKDGTKFLIREIRIENDKE